MTTNSPLQHLAGALRGGPAGAAVLGEQLQTAVREIADWMAEFGP